MLQPNLRSTFWLVLGGKLSIEFFWYRLESIIKIDYYLWFIMVSVGINGSIINKLINIIYKVFLTFFVSNLLEREH